MTDKTRRLTPPDSHEGREVGVFQLVALWSAPKPEDRAAFEEHYLNTHAVKARALGNLGRLETILISQGLEGGAPAWHRVAIMTWPDQTAFARDETTAEWRALREDAGQMIARFGVTLTSSMGRDG
jgi:hypothetical protein